MKILDFVLVESTCLFTIIFKIESQITYTFNHLIRSKPCNVPMHIAYCILQILQWTPQHRKFWFSISYWMKWIGTQRKLFHKLHGICRFTKWTHYKLWSDRGNLLAKNYTKIAWTMSLGAIAKTALFWCVQRLAPLWTQWSVCFTLYWTYQNSVYFGLLCL